MRKKWEKKNSNIKVIRFKVLSLCKNSTRSFKILNICTENIVYVIKKLQKKKKNPRE